MAEDKPELSKEADLIRACLVSVQGEISSHKLNQDFETMVGHSIAFKKFGFNSLDSFIESLADINMRRGANGALILSAGLSKNTEHIYQLVAQQKPPKRVQKLRRKTRKYDADFDDYNKWLEPSSDSDGSGSSVGSPSPVAPLKPQNSRYQGKNFDPNYYSKLKGKSDDRSYQKGAYKQYRPSETPPRFSQRAPSPSKSTASDASDWDRDEMPSNPPDEKPLVDALEAIVLDSKAEDKPETPPEATPYEESEKVEPKEVPFGPKMFLAKSFAIRQKEIEDFQADVARTYMKELSAHVDQMTTMEEYTSGTNFCHLQEFVYERGMPAATFRIERFSPKFCQVVVNHFVFTGYAAETETLKQCLEKTSLDALGVLRALDLPTEVDVKAPAHFINRIMALVYSQPSGIWRSYIPKAYSLKHHEEIPEKWAESFLTKARDVAVVRVNASPQDTMSEIWKPKLVVPPPKPEAATRPAVPPSPAADLRPARPPQRTRTYQPPREGLPSCAGGGDRAGTPPAAVVERLQMALRKTYCVVANQVAAGGGLWVRIAGEEYGPAFDQMQRELAAVHSAPRAAQAVVPTIGACYAAHVRGAWQRVMLTDLRETGSAAVFLIDAGAEEQLPFAECFPLSARFTKMPALAICCVLDGFEEFTMHPEYQKFLREVIVNSIFKAEVLSFEEGKPSVNLTGVGTMSHIQINYYLAELLGHGISDPPTFLAGQVLEVRVPHVDKSGVAHIRVEDNAQKLLHLMSQQLEHKLHSHAPRPVARPAVGAQRYFARLLDTENSIYRVVVLVPPNDAGMVGVSFIDLGDKAMIPMSSVYELQGFFDPLWRLPPQAIAVTLTGLPPAVFSPQLAGRLQEIVPEDMAVLMKIVRSGVVPEVELFKRLLPDNVLVSVNNTLALDPTLVNPIVAELAAGSLLPPCDYVPIEPLAPYPGATSTSMMLPPPVIPPIGSQFDVNVPMVSNPSNFFVQPWDTYYNLQQLMFEMQQAYSGNTFRPLAAEDIAAGLSYAAIHPDGNWYRVKASSHLITEDSVLASFADYGDIQVLQLANMRHLAPQFCELPCQAIRAKLYGVKPLHQDWCVQDCIEFQALVNERQFVSIVMAKQADSDDSGEVTVALKLIDTSGSEDVHVDQMLVSEGMAKYIDNGN